MSVDWRNTKFESAARARLELTRKSTDVFWVQLHETLDALSDAGLLLTDARILDLASSVAPWGQSACEAVRDEATR